MAITEKIGKLGFGLMRLPQKDGKIDVEQTKEMVDLFMESGFNYFDTAWAYPGSEEATREALIERYPRDSFYIATKLSAWRVGTREEAEAQFETSLKRLGTDYIDFYLLHNLGKMRTEPFEKWDIWNFVLEKKREGKVKHIGFSFHSTVDELEPILEAHPEAEFVQLQINYADWENNAVQSRKVYEMARRYGKPIIVMEPVKGGLLAKPPEKVEKVLKDAEPGSSCASWALRFSADLDGVMTVLSGMSNVEQMKDNISMMRGFTNLTQEQRDTVKEASRVLATYPIIPCTTCDYCAKVCPENIGISGTFQAVNQMTLYGNKEFSTSQLNWLVGMHGKKYAKDCIKCGRCEDACPQHIRIREELEKSTWMFE